MVWYPLFGLVCDKYNKDTKTWYMSGLQLKSMQNKLVLHAGYPVMQ